MTMYARLCTIGLILLGLTALAGAAWQYFLPDDGPGLIVEGPNREISDCSASQTTVIAFPFHNRSRHPVQIIGLATC